MYENINAEELAEIISQQKWIIIIPLILSIVFAIFFIRAMKKRSVKSRERLHREINDYMQIGVPQTYVYGGAISVSYDTVAYTRGNRKAFFEIPIDKETILAPCLVDVWFENRNYNGREANLILRDIQHYLLENKICKKVTIVTDEEYEALANEQEIEEDFE